MVSLVQKMNHLVSLPKTFFIFVVIFSFCFIYLSILHPNYSVSSLPTVISSRETDSPTNLSHLVFGLVGSEKAWRHRKPYIQSWWRPNITRGFLLLDQTPGITLLPWSPSAPPYKVSDDLTKLLRNTDITAQRIIHGIMEAFREDNENLRWLVMGDDDSIFFVDNIVDVLSRYDHRKYYYLGGQSEFILSNHWYSFSQGFGGAGFILSYPLAKVLAEDMENCLLRYRYTLKPAADLTTMSCIADIGVSLTPLKGLHQIDMRGDISGFLSSHPQFPLLSLHHFDFVDPLFPSMNRYESTRHLMAAAAADQSRMLQQTICYHRENGWSLSISWGYSAHIYERIMPRGFLQFPIETFRPWGRSPRPPHYMFNTRRPSDHPCEAPHVFFFQTVDKKTEHDPVIATFTRAWPRVLPACSGNNSAEFVSKILVHTPPTKRLEIDRSECCDIVRIHDNKAEVKYRECMKNEIIA
ncbi:uncharacterized protein [Primulina huaijiensis]|uniref:uncharacterized protein n=1 Tax=Primulina huaijiensis TaxID=1492673 RepID=UPI003CC78BA3